MKKVTMWRPDTHELEIEYEWDTEQPDASPVVLSIRGRDASIHQGTPQERFEKVLEENRRKNDAVKEMLGDEPSDEELKKLSWSFDSKRQLRLQHTERPTLIKPRPR